MNQNHDISLGRNILWFCRFPAPTTRAKVSGILVKWKPRELRTTGLFISDDDIGSSQQFLSGAAIGSGRGACVKAQTYMFQLV